MPTRNITSRIMEKKRAIVGKYTNDRGMVLTVHGEGGTSEELLRALNVVRRHLGIHLKQIRAAGKG